MSAGSPTTTASECGLPLFFEPAIARFTLIDRVPTAQENQGNWLQKIPCLGKHGGFGGFAKTQGILFAQVVNSLIPKVKDISKSAVKMSIFFLGLISLPSQFCACNSHKSCK